MNFVGIMLFAGTTNSGNGKYVRLILDESGRYVDAFSGNVAPDSVRPCNELYPNVSFLTQLRVSNAEYKDWQPMINARDKEWHKRSKQGKPFTLESYHAEYHTGA